MKSTLIVLTIAFTSLLSGCTLFAIADAVGSAAIGTAKIAVKGTVAVVDAVIPDGDDEEEEGDN
jgi:hypothetical protein